MMLSNTSIGPQQEIKIKLPKKKLPYLDNPKTSDRRNRQPHHPSLGKARPSLKSL